MDDERETPVAAHELPTCPHYDRLDLLEYLQWVNRTTEAGLAAAAALGALKDPAKLLN